MSEFQQFWPVLNAWLVEQGMLEVSYGEAVGWFRCLAMMGGSTAALNFFVDNTKSLKHRVG